MFQFPGFASKTLCIQILDTFFTALLTAEALNSTVKGGFPHSEIRGSKPIPGFPRLIAGYHVLHRLLLPRHPPNALFTLDLIQKKQRSFWLSEAGSSRVRGTPRTGQFLDLDRQLPSRTRERIPLRQCLVFLNLHDVKNTGASKHSWWSVPGSNR